MTNKFKRQALIAYSLALIGVILLASSLTELRFSPGTPFPSAGNETYASGPGVSYGVESWPWLQGVFVLLFVIALVYITIGLAARLKPVRFRPLLWILIGVFLLALIIFSSPTAQATFLAIDLQSKAAPPPAAAPSVPLGRPPAWLYWTVITGLVLFALITASWMLDKALRRKLSQHKVGLEAETALEALRLGQDYSSVIMRCYLQMQQALLEEQGIQREAHFTPLEFERQLAAIGLPPAPLAELTRLFEKVRYGHKRASQADEGAAVECLSAIARHLRGKEPRLTD